MTKKRAPGGGRKPQDGGKDRRLSIRISSTTWEALDRAQAKSGRTRSREVEQRLTNSLHQDVAADRQLHVRALGEGFMLVVQFIEQRTGCRWNGNPFTAEAVRHGLGLLISHFGPTGTPAMPKKLKDDAAKLPEEFAQRLAEPAEIGLAEAGHVVALVERFNHVDVADISIRAKKSTQPDIQVPTEWFGYAKLLRDLRSRTG